MTAGVIAEGATGARRLRLRLTLRRLRNKRSTTTQTTTHSSTNDHDDANDDTRQRSSSRQQTRPPNGHQPSLPSDYLPLSHFQATAVQQRGRGDRVPQPPGGLAVGCLRAGGSLGRFCSPGDRNAKGESKSFTSKTSVLLSFLSCSFYCSCWCCRYC